ncbi:helix-turn-helix domain-containing protein [Kineococcus sp. LSe6-4]|uniref:Helix-turn-helix domain-containing protein n=1 Tax=Kineococcus halophytocola TaxID=3234027 RepID=A0ABV4H306_9ACTN
MPSTEDVLTALTVLRRHGESATIEAKRATGGLPKSVRETISDLAERGLLARVPDPQHVRYEIAAAPPEPRRDAPAGPVSRPDEVLALLADGREHHVTELAAALGLGRVMVTRYLNELIADGRVVATAPPRNRRRRYRRA